MGFISKIHLAFRLHSGLMPNEERANLRERHFVRGVVSVAKMTAAVAAATAIGFVVPATVKREWWPSSFDAKDLFTSKEGLICVGSAAAASYWAIKNTGGAVRHHMMMAWDPEAEISRALKDDMRELFEIAIKMIITLGTLAVPAYIVTKTVHWLFVA